jgi:hypothetical protein
MIINGLNSTQILIALVLVLLQNSFLYCPRATHSFSKETLSVKALLLGQSKTLYYKVLLYDHSIYSYDERFIFRKNIFIFRNNSLILKKYFNAKFLLYCPAFFPKADNTKPLYCPPFYFIVRLFTL